MGQMKKRHQNHGLRKVCACARRKWAKCEHSWYFNFKPKGGPSHRFSVDAEVGKHVAAKPEAEKHADAFRTAIREGTIRRRTDAPPVVQVTTADSYTIEQFFEKWRENGRANVKDAQRTNDASICKRLSDCTIGEDRFGARVIGAITEDDLERVFGQFTGLAPATWNKYRHTLIRRSAGDAERATYPGRG